MASEVRRDSRLPHRADQPRGGLMKLRAGELEIPKEIVTHLAWMIPVLGAARSVASAPALADSMKVSVLFEALCNYDKATRNLPPLVVETTHDGGVVLEETTAPDNK